MPNYTTANLVKAQALLTQAFNAGELRFRDPVLFKAFLRSTEIMVPSHKVLRVREDRAIEANGFARTSRALGTGGRIHNHTGARGDAFILNPSWTPYDDVYVNTLKGSDNSVFTPEQIANNELFQVIANFAEGTETLAANYLFNNRSGVNNAVVEGTFNAVNDVFEITETTNGDRAIQITKSIMDINKYSGPYLIVSDTVAFNKFEKDSNQGSGNSENLAFQYSGAEFLKSIETDTNSASLSYTKGMWYAIPMGMIACLDWIPKQNRLGATTKVSDYASIINPVDNLTYAVHWYPERVDGTSLNGYTQDVKEEFQVSIDLAFEHAPLTTANETPILAFALV